MKGNLGMEKRLHQNHVLPLLIGIDKYVYAGCGAG